MKEMAAVFLLVSVSMTALAQQERTFLPKADVEALANGKKGNHVRVEGGSKIRWDLRNGGQLLANNLAANQSDSGTW